MTGTKSRWEDIRPIAMIPPPRELSLGRLIALPRYDEDMRPKEGSLLPTAGQTYRTRSDAYRTRSDGSVYTLAYDLMDIARWTEKGLRSLHHEYTVNGKPRDGGGAELPSFQPISLTPFQEPVLSRVHGEIVDSSEGHGWASLDFSGTVLCRELLSGHVSRTARGSFSKLYSELTTDTSRLSEVTANRRMQPALAGPGVNVYRLYDGHPMPFKRYRVVERHQGRRTVRSHRPRATVVAQTFSSYQNTQRSTAALVMAPMVAAEILDRSGIHVELWLAFAGKTISQSRLACAMLRVPPVRWLRETGRMATLCSTEIVGRVLHRNMSFFQPRSVREGNEDTTSYTTWGKTGLEWHRGVVTWEPPAHDYFLDADKKGKLPKAVSRQVEVILSAVVDDLTGKRWTSQD